MALKVCVVTGSRSEYDRQYWFLKDLTADPAFDVQIVVTGGHLDKKFGLTINEIKKDGFRVAAKVPMNLSSDRTEAIAQAVGAGLQGFAKTFTKLRPDVVIIYGDRYELLGVSAAAVAMGIPLAHIGGGQLTEGAIDNQIRQMLTKSAHIHFVANRSFAGRLEKMGEEPWRICTSGSPALDCIKRLKLLSNGALQKELKMTISDNTALVTFHPVTLDLENLQFQMQEFISALKEAHKKFGLNYVVTYPNADAGSYRIIDTIEKFASQSTGFVRCVKNLGQLKYLSLLKKSRMMIGNSSSGIIEAPSFNVPAVNIGNRQEGRLFAENVIRTGYTKDEIVAGIREAMRYCRSGCVNPYGTMEASPKMIAFLKKVFKEKSRRDILTKVFYEVKGQGQGMKKVFIIAEAGVNHNGDIEIAKKLIDAAIAAKVDAVKFQTFKPGEVTGKFAFKVDYQAKATARDESRYEMSKKLALPYEDFGVLKKYCEEKGGLFLSTPDGYASLEYLTEQLNIPVIKISSTEMTHVQFLKAAALKNRPIILSTGMSTLKEVERAVEIIRSHNKKELTLLHCTSEYPCPYDEVNLRAMVTMKDYFQVPVGYSDHTIGTQAAVAAVALGASVIEKHFTLDKNLPGPDHQASLNPRELKEFVETIRITERLLGDGVKQPTASELRNISGVRRSVVAACAIVKGTVLLPEMLTFKRPNTGIHPFEVESVIGRALNKDLEEDEVLKWEHLR